jgi:hypothetical protein
MRVTVDGCTAEGTPDEVHALIALRGRATADVKEPPAVKSQRPAVPFGSLIDREFWTQLFREQGWHPPNRSTLVYQGVCNMHGTTLRYANAHSPECVQCVRGRDVRAAR